MTCDTPTIEWREKIALPKLPLNGVELALLAALMKSAGGQWSCEGGGWIFQEDAFTTFHRVLQNQTRPAVLLQQIGAM